MGSLACDEPAAAAAAPAGSNRREVIEPGLRGRFKNLQKIGEGTYGIVYKAEDDTIRDSEDESSTVAVKKVRLDDNDEGVPVTTLREVALLKDLRHTNIVRLREVIASPPRLYLVFDFLDQDLKQCLESRFKSGMPPGLVRSCMVQILRGLHHCHAHLVLHRDLKPQNVLISRSGAVKLADFGLARAFQLSGKYTHEVVTLWYRAPELLLGLQQYSTGLDIWSVGCIFAELTSRKPLFPGDSEIDELFKIFRHLGTPNEEMWPGVTELPHFLEQFPTWRSKPITSIVPQLAAMEADLLSHMVVYEPSRRLEADECLAHEYFDPVRERSQEQLPSLNDFTGPSPSQTVVSQTRSSRPGMLRPGGPPINAAAAASLLIPAAPQATAPAAAAILAASTAASAAADPAAAAAPAAAPDAAALATASVATALSAAAPAAASAPAASFSLDCNAAALKKAAEPVGASKAKVEPDVARRSLQHALGATAEGCADSSAAIAASATAAAAAGADASSGAAATAALAGKKRGRAAGPPPEESLAAQRPRRNSNGGAPAKL